MKNKRFLIAAIASLALAAFCTVALFADDKPATSIKYDPFYR